MLYRALQMNTISQERLDAWHEHRTGRLLACPGAVPRVVLMYQVYCACEV